MILIVEDSEALVYNKFLTVKDIQNILKISQDMAYKIVNTDGFPSIKIGRTIRIPEEEFEKWVKKYTYTKFNI